MILLGYNIKRSVGAAEGDPVDGKKVALAVVGIIALIGGGILIATQMNANNTKEEEKTSVVEQKPAEPTATIVGLAAATPDLSTLVTAVTEAGLVDTLNGDGPFTVFAPTNEAFAKLPAGTLDTLLLPENVELLKSILTYHVVASKVLSSDLTDGQVVTTVQGSTLTVGIKDGVVTLTDAKGSVATVTTADVKAKNGVVHIIDTVVQP